MHLVLCAFVTRVGLYDKEIERIKHVMTCEVTSFVREVIPTLDEVEENGKTKSH
jgi:hypothetical protein